MVSKSAERAMKRVATYLEDSETSQKDFAAACGIARPTLNKYLSLEMEPSLAALEKIADQMDVPLSGLVRDDAAEAEVAEAAANTPSPSMLAIFASEALNEWAKMKTGQLSSPSFPPDVFKLAERLSALDHRQRAPLMAALRVGIDAAEEAGGEADLSQKNRK